MMHHELKRRIVVQSRTLKSMDGFKQLSII